MATIPQEPKVNEIVFSDATYNGMRMSVDDYYELPEDGSSYELIDGVVVMSPRPTPPHQRAVREVVVQLAKFVDDHPIGELFFEIDIQLSGQGESNAIVYAPDVIFVLSNNKIVSSTKIHGAPDLVVEIVSPGSRRMDTVTKRHDYERFGVREYWIIDPALGKTTFLHNKDGIFVESVAKNDHFASEAVPGFQLDLAAIRETFTRS